MTILTTLSHTLPLVQRQQGCWGHIGPGQSGRLLLGQQQVVLLLKNNVGNVC